MEADFRRYYGIRLWADLATDRLPWRQFQALLNGLPWDSAYARAITGGDNAVSTDTQLLAMAVDALHAWLWGNADPKTRGDAPGSITARLLGITEQPRIGRSSLTPAEMAARLKAQAEQHAQEMDGHVD